MNRSCVNGDDKNRARRAKFSDDRKNANREIGVPTGAEAKWISRGYLPHQSSTRFQHVRFHLADSVPKAGLLQIENELRTVTDDRRDVERRKRLDAWTDSGYGSCVLWKPEIAGMMQGALLEFESRRYRLSAWVIMPNHVHVLFQPLSGWLVAKIVASWKKFSARMICHMLRDAGKKAGPVWHREYWDRYMRDSKHLAKAIEYIHMNPVKAGLADRAEDWRWSSAHTKNNEK